MKYRIAWLVHPPIKGSGGHRTIYAHVRMLAKMGHECHVFVIPPPELPDNQDPAWPEQIRNYFDPGSETIIHSWHPPITAEFDMVVATWWMTAYDARHIKAGHRVYFVQDFEPYFYPMGDHYLLAEQTYKLDFIPITIGRWLSMLMQKRYNKPAGFFDFTADNKIYHPIRQKKKEKAVCFIYQPEKARRCHIIAFNALAIVKKMCPEVTIYTYGTSEVPDMSVPGNHLGLLTREECNDLYNRCRVGLCISSSNPSRVPFEMMASGLPVVDVYGENTIYDFPNRAILLATPSPEYLAGAIVKILASKTMQHEMTTAGTEFMKKHHASKEQEQSSSLFLQILNNRHTKSLVDQPRYSAPPFQERQTGAISTLPKLFFPPKQAANKTYYDPKTGLIQGFNRDLLYWLANNRLCRAIRVIITGQM